MSDILKSEILPVAKTEKKGSVAKTTNEPKKEGNSLFDNILNKSKQLSESSKEEVKEQKKSPIDNKQVVNNTSKEEPKLESKPTGSLLDRMVKNIKEDSSKDNVGAKIETTKTNEKKEINSEVQVTKKNELKEDSTQNKESKSASSLLDKMVKDIKADSVETKPQQKEVKAKIEEKTQKSETIQSDNKVNLKEESNAKKSQVTTSELEKKETEVKIASKNNSLESKTEAKEEKKETTSLLDRMVKDIKKNEPEIKDEGKLQTKDAVAKVVDTTSTQSEEKPFNKSAQSDDVDKLKSTVVVDKNVAENIESVVKKELNTTQKEETTKTTKQTSLMDNLIKQSTQVVTTKKTDQGEVVSEQKIVTSTTVETEKVDGKEPLQANMFLSNQKTKKELLSKQKVTEVKESLENEKSGTKGVEKAAKTLELNPSEAVIEKEEVTEDKSTLQEKKNLDQQIKQQNNMLNRVFLKSYTKLEEIHNNQVQQAQMQKSAEVKAVEDNAKQVKEEIEIVVEKSVAQSITTRIVESKQKMGSFMSEMARNMYANYKPPVTAFKINLTPANLGNIAIMMRNNKSDNSITVSLNMSQNNTLEVFNDNKSTLQNNLTKLFSEDTNVALEFGMQNDNSNSNFEQAKQEQEKNANSNRISTADILAGEENTQESSLYM